MAAVFKRLFSKARDKIRQIVFEALSWVRSVKEIFTLEAASNESKKFFYLFSLMLFVSLVFMSPDKILQTLASMQSETGMLERIHDLTRMLRRLAPGPS